MTPGRELRGSALARHVSPCGARLQLFTCCHEEAGVQVWSPTMPYTPCGSPQCVGDEMKTPAVDPAYASFAFRLGINSTHPECASLDGKTCIKREGEWPASILWLAHCLISLHGRL